MCIVSAGFCLSFSAAGVASAATRIVQEAARASVAPCSRQPEWPRSLHTAPFIPRAHLLIAYWLECNGSAHWSEKMLRCDNGVLVPLFKGRGTPFSTVLCVR